MLVPSLLAAAALACCPPPAEGIHSQPSGFALDFDGINDIAHIAGSPDLAFPEHGNLTVDFWIFPRAMPNDMEAGIISQESVGVFGHDPWGFRYQRGHYIWKIEGTDGSDTIEFNLEPNTWHHIIGNYSHGDNGGNMSVIVDNRMVASRRTRIVMESREDPIRLGNVGKEFGHPYFNGAIDELRIMVSHPSRRIMAGSMPITLESRKMVIGNYTFDAGDGSIIANSVRGSGTIDPLGSIVLGDSTSSKPGDGTHPEFRRVEALKPPPPSPTPVPLPIPFRRNPADVTLDGKLDRRDLLLFERAFEIKDPIADINGDGIVDSADHGLFFGNYRAATAQP